MFLCLCDNLNLKRPTRSHGFEHLVPTGAVFFFFFVVGGLVGRGGSLGLAFEGYSLLLSSLLSSYPRACAMLAP